jgi:hypothetical protein
MVSRAPTAGCSTRVTVRRASSSGVVADIFHAQDRARGHPVLAENLQPPPTVVGGEYFRQDRDEAVPVADPLGIVGEVRVFSQARAAERPAILPVGWADGCDHQPLPVCGLECLVGDEVVDGGQHDPGGGVIIRYPWAAMSAS